jgi:hypothetical protein
VRIVSEAEFADRIRGLLTGDDGKPATAYGDVGSVTGPGRSGAVAAVYASHILHVPFIPYGAVVPTHLGRLLIIDTAMESGATLRKAERRYRDADPIVVACYHEPPRVAFWYEAPKPQRYRHERRGANDNHVAREAA